MTRARLAQIYAERVTTAARLRRQAARLRKAAKLLEVAAIYEEDGAPLTAVDRVNEAGEHVRNTARYMTAGRWRVRN